MGVPTCLTPRCWRRLSLSNESWWNASTWLMPIASLIQQDQPGPCSSGALGGTAGFLLSPVSGKEEEAPGGGKERHKAEFRPVFCKVWSVAGPLLPMNHLPSTMQSPESGTWRVLRPEHLRWKWNAFRPWDVTDRDKGGTQATSFQSIISKPAPEDLSR